MGLLIRVVVQAASSQDRAGAQALFALATELLSRLIKVGADNGYRGDVGGWVRDADGWILEIVRRPEDQVGFEVQPKRWIVERTFGWFGRYRRLSKDYEYYTGVSEAFIYAAMIHLMLRRLAP